MIKPVKTLFFSLLVFSFSLELPAMEAVGLWRHSKTAGANSVFFDVGFAPLFFKDLDFENFDLGNFEFSFMPLDIRVDYMLPLPLPVSLGAFIKTPNPNLNSFGLRLAYHIDLYDSYTDLYFLYSFDLGFLRNGIMKEYNDAPVEIHYYDFRAGIRRFFGSSLGLSVETGFKFESVVFLLSIKIN